MKKFLGLKSIKQVPDLSKVTPGDYNKESATDQQEKIDEAQQNGTEPPVFTQNFLSGPGWVAVTESDRHFSLVLVQN